MKNERLTEIEDEMGIPFPQERPIKRKNWLLKQIKEAYSQKTLREWQKYMHERIHKDTNGKY